MIYNTILLLRIFAEVKSMEEATNIACEITELAEGKNCESEFRVQKYWKIPEYFEIILNLKSKEKLETSFNGLISELGGIWELHEFPNERWAVWNFEEGASANRFFHSKIRWAHLETIGSFNL